MICKDFHQRQKIAWVTRLVELLYIALQRNALPATVQNTLCATFDNVSVLLNPVQYLGIHTHVNIDLRIFN